MPDLFAISPLSQAMRDALAPHFTVCHIADMHDPVAWLDTNGTGIRHALTDGHLGLRPEFLDRLPDLELISSFGVGYDGIDTSAVTARGVIVTHTPDVLNDEVATTAMLLFLSCYRNWEAELRHARRGIWATRGNLPLSRSADNRHVGILGLGRIGMQTARRLQAFGAEISYHTRTPRDVPYRYCDDLRAMARDVDALISIVPGGAATRHIIDAAVLDALGPEGVLVNVGRGSSVDETALIAALNENRLGWAGLDVYDDEPQIPAGLRDHPRTILAPHVGSATVETRAAMGKLTCDNLIHHLTGQPLLTPIAESRHLLPPA